MSLKLVKFRYLRLSRQGKGVVIRHLMKISGYSRQQLTRLSMFGIGSSQQPLSALGRALKNQLI